jgi:hypothetical protein
MKLFLAAAAIDVVASNVYDGNMTLYLARMSINAIER